MMSAFATLQAPATILSITYRPALSEKNAIVPELCRFQKKVRDF
jgi:hypothetical protein